MSKNNERTGKDGPQPAHTRKPADRQGAARVTQAYHHGDLRAALMKAAEHLAAQKGLEGFSLRECAKMAGVSPAAPAYHFGSAAGLLEAVATAGFDELSHRMQMATEGMQNALPEKRIAAMAHAYIEFARTRPGSFKVTFGGSLVPSETGNAALIAASERTFGILLTEVTKLPAQKPAPGTALKRALFIWSFVHGFANLLADRRMTFLTGNQRAPGGIEALIASVVAEFESRLAGN